MLLLELKPFRSTSPGAALSGRVREMKIEKFEVDRRTIAVELLVEAASLVDRRGSLPVAVTLARAGAQAFADRVIAGGNESALKVAAGVTQELLGSAFGWDWLRDYVQRPSNAIKHGNKASESESVVLSYEIATMLVVCGTADCRTIMGACPASLVDFCKRHSDQIRGRLSDSTRLMFEQAFPRV